MYKLLPEAGGSGYPAWETSKAYTNGMMVQSTTNGLNYMCLVTGTSTNDATKAPIGFSDYTEGTCTWRPALAKPRKLVIICNDGDGTAYVTTEYSSAAAGVGKTYKMLEEAQQLKKNCVDVVVALVETHGRPETEVLLEGLEVTARLRLDRGGIQTYPPIR